MTTALTLTPQSASASVLTQVTGAPAGPVTITRVDANGANPVRLLDGQEPISGDLTVTDYEPALLGIVRYDVADSLGVTTSVSTTLVDLIATPILHTPVLPQYRYLLEHVIDYGSGRENLGTIHQIINRVDPLITTGRLALRRGSLKMLASSHEMARAIEAIANFGEVMMLRQSDHVGMDMYFVAESTDIAPDQLTTWTVSMSYVEVSNPSSPLMGSVGWNFGTIAAVGSFADIRSQFPTFADLVVGPN